MTFLNQNMLWGVLALAMPITIHFWYQKKGKLLAWAATQWLVDKTSLQHRGLRLDEIPLLLLRCLLLLLFVLLLSKPVLDKWTSLQTDTKIHLVEPNQNLVENFRFELENALKNGEKIYWIGAEESNVSGLSALPKGGDIRLYLQQNVSRFSAPNVQLNIYLTNSQQLAKWSKIYLEGPFKIFSAVDSSKSDVGRYFDFGSKGTLFVDAESGDLKLLNSKANSPKLNGEPVRKSEISVLLEYKSEIELQTVHAALKALGEVYSMPFSYDFKLDPNKKYDCIFTDRVILNADPEVLYFSSGKNYNQYPSPNIIQIKDSLRLASSEMVQNGALPEFIGKTIVTHYQLGNNNNVLSNQQLHALFEQVEPDKGLKSDRTGQWIMVLFIIALVLERWIALKKTVTQNYG